MFSSWLLLLSVFICSFQALALVTSDLDYLVGSYVPNTTIEEYSAHAEVNRINSNEIELNIRISTAAGVPVNKHRLVLKENAGALEGVIESSGDIATPGYADGPVGPTAFTRKSSDLSCPNFPTDFSTSAQAPMGLQRIVDLSPGPGITNYSTTFLNQNPSGPCKFPIFIRIDRYVDSKHLFLQFVFSGKTSQYFNTFLLEKVN